jgi:G:T-mismatch repair DNA endonuclease (very short patch repair protein)
MNYHAKPCKHCGNSFTPTSGKAKWCSICLTDRVTCSQCGNPTGVPPCEDSRPRLCKRCELKSPGRVAICRLAGATPKPLLGQGKPKPWLQGRRVENRLRWSPEVMKRWHASLRRSANTNHFTSALERRLGDLLQIPSEYRRYWIDGIGEVDLADPQFKIAIEVQGCYWHGCLSCGFVEPGNKGQRKRDLAKRSKLEALGWTLVEVWEHNLANVEVSHDHGISVS